MRSFVALVAALLLISVAGCLDPSSSSEAVGGKTKLSGKAPQTASVIKEEAFAEIRTLLADVPCEAPVSMETSKNLLQLDVVKFDDSEAPVGAQEVDIHEDMLLMAAGTSGAAGFELWNIANPLKPYQLSNWTETKAKLDVKFSPDGTTAFVGAGWGIDVVDITNPLIPERASQFQFSSVPNMPGELGRNAHMMYTAEIADEQWLFLAPNSNTGVWILKIVGEGATRSLEFITTTQAIEGGPLGPHDMYVQYDEDLKQWLVYSSDGFHGWEVFDVSDPTSPELVGGFIRPEGGYTHTIQAQKINGKRIVVTIAEVGVNILEVYDASDLRTPILLGVWNIATFGTPNPVGLTFPQHNFNLVDGKMFLAHYGSGLFVFDLAKLTGTPIVGTTELEPMAHYASAATQSAPTSFNEFWDVVLKDGLVYGANRVSGVHVIGFGCLDVGNPLLTSDG
ncbi:MAG TPA: hypothetical protein VGB18_07505 [Candidatus Thermoplasmatota archaeon]